MKQNHVARRACIFDDLQRDASMFFNVFHEPGRALVGIAFAV